MIRWPERLLPHQIQYEVVAHPGVVPYALFEGNVALQKLQNGDVAVCIVYAGLLHSSISASFWRNSASVEA